MAKGSRSKVTAPRKKTPAAVSRPRPAAYEVTIQNRQKTRALDVRLLRQVTNELLAQFAQLTRVELGLNLVAAAEMTHVNETFLQHEGSTDVITFDYREPAPSVPDPKPQTPNPIEVCGELFICVDEAILQARRFQTQWPVEVVRYVVHGLLHLQGYDDHAAADRREMKREENRLVRLLAARFPLSRLARKPRLPR